MFDVDKVIELVHAMLALEEEHMDVSGLVPKTGLSIVDMKLHHAPGGSTVVASRLDVEGIVNSPALGSSV